MSYEGKMKKTETVALICVVTFIGALFGSLVLNPHKEVKKTPKPLREITSTVSNEVNIIKLSFDTGYRACLENVLDGYILYGDSEEFENFLHAQVDMAVKPNLGLEQ